MKSLVCFQCTLYAVSYSMYKYIITHLTLKKILYRQHNYRMHGMHLSTFYSHAMLIYTLENIMTLWGAYEIGQHDQIDILKRSWDGLVTR